MVAGQAILTIIVVVGFMMKIEHRLSKIETDVEWIKRNIELGCERNCDEGKNRQVD